MTKNMEENKTGKQPETAKKNERGRKESQPLTPEEIRKRRKMLVYPLLFLVFGVAMWGESLPDGFNVEVPMPEEKNLPSDKRAAYEQQDFERKQREKMSTLQDLAVAEDDTDREAVEDVFQTEETASSGGSSIRTSADAYRDINRQIGSFYEQPEPEDDQDEQLRLMEKSYEMASRYLPQEGGGAKSVPVTETKGRTVSPVTQVAEQVVSMLAQPMSDAEFMERYSRPHNMGFHTGVSARNSIRACIRRTVTVSDGKEAEIRLLEPVDVGGMYVPANTVLTATARINGERMELTVSSIAYKGTVVPVELEVYDPSGMKGISVPGSQELTALKEMAANMGSTMGSSINISTNAGAQLASDLGRGAIQGLSQYLATKFRTVKVTLKANHAVLLVAKK